MSLILTILNPSFIIGILILIPILWLFNCMNKKGGVNIDNFTSCLFKGGVNTICKMTIGQATGAKTCDVATDAMSSVVSTTTNFAKGFITRPVNLVKNLAKGNFEGVGEVLYNMNPAILFPKTGLSVVYGGLDKLGVPTGGMRKVTGGIFNTGQKLTGGLIGRIGDRSVGGVKKLIGGDIGGGVTDLVRSNPLVAGVETLADTGIGGDAVDAVGSVSGDAVDAIDSAGGDAIDAIGSAFSF